MTIPYDHKLTEEKWKKRWADERHYILDLNDAERKLYCLVMFSYPSGDKLHVGHWYNYAPTDTWARFKMMQGFRVFEPMGFDAFGLPAENHAIKTGGHPQDITNANTAFMTKQLRSIGAMYDWTRTVDTSKPEYYKWTQWIFLKLYERGLAYRKMAPVNWCPSCNTVLANEQVIDGACERCSSEVTKKDLEQWFFRITDYAERLLAGHGKLNWPERTLTMQKNWIGRSEGAEIDFKIEGFDEKTCPPDGGTAIPPVRDAQVENLCYQAGRISVFTTRADTLFGATYIVLAPEHPLVEKITFAERMEEVKKYREWARALTDIERASLEREKTGVFTGAFAVNPINNEKIPVWIADYVLLTYGTGAVMAVPGHDERDYEFAKKFNLTIREVIKPTEGAWDYDAKGAFTDDGIMINSAEFDGLSSEKGRRAVVKKLASAGAGRETVSFRLRDWLISRQRYWGAPIPIIYCQKCGMVPEKEENLPVLLPYKVNLKIAKSGKSPLAFVPEFLKAHCPKCNAPSVREADTMDTFVDSSWYFLRYLSPALSDKAWDETLSQKWLPVDMYVGGAEHACMHLLYARFIAMALCDMGLIHFEEPFLNLVHQGVITNQGAKMSKSKGNVVQPEPYLEKHGADVFRMYLMFMGPYAEGGDWSDAGINGLARFRDRVWRLFETETARSEHPTETSADLKKEFLRIRHFTVREVSEDMEKFQFNTAIARLMEFQNFLMDNASALGKEDIDDALKTFALLIAPFAPHFAEELRERFLGQSESIFKAKWPAYDASFIATDTVTVVVQINGRKRAEISVPRGADEKAVCALALAEENIKRYAPDTAQIKRSIYVKDRLLNLVVGGE